jgi:transcriptional regulator with XRE-family HTH domain
LSVKLTSDTFGRRLAKIREHRDLTQFELGAAVGQSKQTISAWEHDRTIEITRADVSKCARALGCRRADLLAPVEAPLPPCPDWSRVKRQLRRNFALRRLREDRPDLRARVFAGELSLHAAMIEAGWAQARKPNRWRVVQDASVSETQRATASGGLRDNVVPDLERDVAL